MEREEEQLDQALKGFEMQLELQRGTSQDTCI